MAKNITNPELIKAGEEDRVEPVKQTHLKKCLWSRAATPTRMTPPIRK